MWHFLTHLFLWNGTALDGLVGNGIYEFCPQFPCKKRSFRLLASSFIRGLPVNCHSKLSPYA